MQDTDMAIQKFRQGCVIPALPLALDQSYKWDQRQQRALLRYYLDAGAGGIAVAVHTTQFAIRDPQHALFIPLLHLASEEIDAFCQKNQKPIMKIAGVCGPVSQARQEAHAAAKAGYHAVLLSPGGLGDCTEQEMLDRTCQIADIIPVVAFYLQEDVGGRRFSFEYWQQLCAIDQVIGIKCAPFDRYQTIELIRAAALSHRSRDITLYTGNDDHIIQDLLTTYKFEENGIIYTKDFAGGLLGHWAVWTRSAVEMFEQIRCRKTDKMIESDWLTTAEAVTDCNSAFFDARNQFAGCIAGVNEVLRRQGLLQSNNCLNPDEVLSPGQSKEIDRVYRMYPHLNDDAFVKENLSRWLSD